MPKNGSDTDLTTGNRDVPANLDLQSAEEMKSGFAIDGLARHGVTSNVLLDVLTAWEKGDASRSDVQGFAEHAFEQLLNAHPQEPPETDSRYLLLEILSQLDFMYTFEIDRGDIPALRTMPRLATHAPEKALAALDEFLDETERRQHGRSEEKRNEHRERRRREDG